MLSSVLLYVDRCPTINNSSILVRDVANLKRFAELCFDFWRAGIAHSPSRVRENCITWPTSTESCWYPQKHSISTTTNFAPSTPCFCQTPNTRMCTENKEPSSLRNVRLIQVRSAFVGLRQALHWPFTRNACPDKATAPAAFKTVSTWTKTFG